MQRQFRTRGLILKSSRMKEGHKSITVLSMDVGLFPAVVHGAFRSKSRKSGSSEPITLCTCYLYFNPVRKSYKIEDLVPEKAYPHVKGDLRKLYTASLWMEIIIGTHGGHEDVPRVMDLVEFCLDRLETADQEAVSYLQLQFLWQYAGIIGFQPDPGECIRCGASTETERLCAYSRHDRGFLCRNCADRSMPRLSEEALRYLARTANAGRNNIFRLALSESDRAQLLNVLLEHTRYYCEKELKSLESGAFFF